MEKTSRCVNRLTGLNGVRSANAATRVPCMTMLAFVGCSFGGAPAGPRSWLATEHGTVVFLTIDVDSAGKAAGSFSVDLHAGGSAGIPVLDVSEHYTMTGAGDASGLVLRLVRDGGGTGSGTATYRGFDPRDRLHASPKGGSWINLVERFSALLTVRQVGRGSESQHGRSRGRHPQLRAIHSEHPRPMVGATTADQLAQRGGVLSANRRLRTLGTCSY